MKLKILAVCLAASLLVGCEARQMNLVAPDLGTFVDNRAPIKEDDIRKAFDQRPNLKPGNTVGIVFIPQSDASGFGVKTMSSEESKAWQAAFRDNYFITDVVFLSASMSPSIGPRDMLVLRKHAATLHCDMLLIYSVSCDYSRAVNPFSALYLTVVGAFVVPGDSVTIGSIAKLVLIDVREGYVYGVVEASATQSMALPMMWLPGSLPRLFETVSSQAVREARQKLTPLIDRLRDQAVELVQ